MEGVAAVFFSRENHSLRLHGPMKMRRRRQEASETLADRFDRGSEGVKTTTN